MRITVSPCRAPIHETFLENLLSHDSFSNMRAWCSRRTVGRRRGLAGLSRGQSEFALFHPHANQPKERPTTSGRLDLPLPRRARGRPLTNPMQPSGPRWRIVGTSPQLKLLALDAASGRELWHFDPFADGAGGGSVGVNRGVVYW